MFTVSFVDGRGVTWAKDYATEEGALQEFNLRKALTGTAFVQVAAFVDGNWKVLCRYLGPWRYE